MTNHAEQGPAGGLPDTPALGRAARLGSRQIAVRAAILVGLLAAALIVRATGVLQSDQGDRALPPLPAVAHVLPGLIRAGTPSEPELVLLRDTFAVRGVVVVGPASVEEQAVVPALGMRLLRLDVADGAAPTAQQVVELMDFVRSVQRQEGQGPGTVVMHDGTGKGPVLVTAAMAQLMDGRSLDAVLAEFVPAETAALSTVQNQALRDAAAALAGAAVPNNPYVTLTR